MSDDDRIRWEKKYSSREPELRGGDDWLVESISGISYRSGHAVFSGRALDVACGMGQNARWLAGQGWRVDGVDVSPTALSLASRAAEVAGVQVNWIEADLDEWLPEPGNYDLVVVFRFLDRELVPRIIRHALRPGGWLIYETFSEAQTHRTEAHIRNPAYVLAVDELKSLFADFDVIAHREDVLDDRTVQRLLARNPESPVEEV